MFHTAAEADVTVADKSAPEREIEKVGVLG